MTWEPLPPDVAEWMGMADDDLRTWHLGGRVDSDDVEGAAMSELLAPARLAG